MVEGEVLFLPMSMIMDPSFPHCVDGWNWTFGFYLEESSIRTGPFGVQMVAQIVTTGSARQLSCQQDMVLRSSAQTAITKSCQ